MSIADRRREKFVAWVTPQLEPGEQIRGVLPFAQTGPTPWFVAVTYIVLFFIKYVGFAATDRRVIEVRRGKITNRIKGIEGSTPLGQFRVVEWKANTLWSRMIVDRPAGPLKLNVHRMHRADAESFMAALVQPPVAPPPPA